MTLGWVVTIHDQGQDHFVAVSYKDGHTCVGESDGELGALVALKRSIREVDPPDKLLHIDSIDELFPVRTASITSANGELFSKAVYAFGFEAFMDKGRGIVILVEGDMTRHDDASIDAKLQYHPAGN